MDDSAITKLGLTESEASARLAAGQGNTTSLRTGRTYPQIVRDNVFNVINDLLFALGITLIVLGRYLDAVISVGVVLANSIVGLFQEIRAKRQLDRIAILTRPKATVVRDGVEREIDPSGIVLGDVLVVHPGDQLVVDGSLVAGGPLEVDESLLTGESDLVPKKVGDTVMSGSFCVSGGGAYTAEKVGADSFANRLTSQAQAHRRVLTPLQRQVSAIIRLLLLLVLVFEVLVIVKSLVGSVPFVETVRNSTVIVALIPNGLILSIALAYALGAARMAGKGTLVQRANAVESLSNVDVLCTDKTGTLTTNAIRFHALEPLDGSQEEAGRLLAAFAAATEEGNRTAQALAAAFPGAAAPPAPPRVVAEAPFASQRKWSGLALDGPGVRGTFVLGAPEIVATALPAGTSLGGRLAEWTAAGLRVLLFAGTSEPDRFGTGEGDDTPRLPGGLRPLALLAFSDELRDGVQATLAEFAAADIAVKVISGDNPRTVAALATQAGLGRDITAIAGADLTQLDDAGLEQAAETASVFGRVTPEQKEQLARALRARGHYVAMVGDGVNDVIALKAANLSIAVQGGSQAARGVADLILTQDSFSALPAAFREGQRIRNGMQDILNIFMVRIFSKAALIAVMLPFGGFPFAPRNSSLLTFLTAGVPVVGLASWAHPGQPLKGSIYRPLLRFALPPTLLLLAMGSAIHAAVRLGWGRQYRGTHPGATGQAVLDHVLPLAQTSTITFLILCGLLLLPFTVPPLPAFTGGAALRRDWRPTLLAAGLFALFVVISATPLGRHLFELAALPLWLYPTLTACSVLWAVLVRTIWRTRWLDRLLRSQPPVALATDMPAPSAQ